jgi:hypothetical protein
VRKHVTHLQQVLADHEFTVSKMRMNSHLVIHADHVTGASCIFVASATPSDHRGIKNFKALVRRSASALSL